MVEIYHLIFVLDGIKQPLTRLLVLKCVFMSKSSSLRKSGKNLQCFPGIDKARG